MNYDTHVGNDLNVNLPTSNNSKDDLETRPLHKLDLWFTSDSCETCFIMKGLGVYLSKCKNLPATKVLFISDLFFW